MLAHWRGGSTQFIPDIAVQAEELEDFMGSRMR